MNIQIFVNFLSHFSPNAKIEVRNVTLTGELDKDTQLNKIWSRIDKLHSNIELLSCEICRVPI